MVITGAHFTGAMAVSFGGTPAQSFTVNSDTQITATVDGGSSGVVSVTTPGGTAGMNGFSYYLPPTITSFTPVSAGLGNSIEINGTYLSGASAVTFGGTPAQDYFVNPSGTRIIAIVGNGSSGMIGVTTLGGTVGFPGFTFLALPVIYDFSPALGGYGTCILISGTNFSGTTNVTFGGFPARSFSINSDTQIMAIVDRGASGEVSITTPEARRAKQVLLLSLRPSLVPFPRLWPAAALP